MPADHRQPGVRVPLRRERVDHPARADGERPLGADQLQRHGASPGPRRHVTTTIVSGLGFPESPRWHDDALWFVDVFRGRVMRSDERGAAVTVAQIDDDVSGMGFLPDGSPLVVSMRRRRVLRLGNGRPGVHADLAALTPGYLNDMVVDDTGRAFVGAIANVVDPGDG